jgi:hypothetical protein
MFAEGWCVKAGERIYGPYSARDLRKFAHEGRFAPWSLVAPAGGRDWREARSEPSLAAFFGLDGAPEPPAAFGRLVDPPTQSPSRPRRAEPLRRTASAPRAAANFILIFDVVSGAAGRIESALLSLGPAFRLAANVWTIASPLTAIGVRNAIAPHLRPHESLFVVDATNGRTSWQNYPPEAHAKITQAFVHAAERRPARKEAEDPLASRSEHP